MGLKVYQRLADTPFRIGPEVAAFSALNNCCAILFHFRRSNMVQEGLLASDGARTMGAVKRAGSAGTGPCDFSSSQREDDILVECPAFGKVVKGFRRKTKALGSVFLLRRSAWGAAAGWAHNLEGEGRLCYSPSPRMP